MMKTRNCISWLWNATKGFRIPIAGNSLTGILHAGVSLLFVFACKQVIDAVTRPSFECLHRRNAGLHGSPIAAVGPTQPDRKRDRDKNAQSHEQPIIQPPNGKQMDRTGRFAHWRYA